MILNSAVCLHNVYFDWSFSITGFSAGATSQLSHLNGSVVASYSVVVMWVSLVRSSTFKDQPSHLGYSNDLSLSRLGTHVLSRLVQLFWLGCVNRLLASRLRLSWALTIPIGITSFASFILAVSVAVSLPGRCWRTKLAYSINLWGFRKRGLLTLEETEWPDKLLMPVGRFFTFLQHSPRSNSSENCCGSGPTRWSIYLNSHRHSVDFDEKKLNSSQKNCLKTFLHLLWRSGPEHSYHDWRTCHQRSSNSEYALFWNGLIELTLWPAIFNSNSRRHLATSKSASLSLPWSPQFIQPECFLYSTQEQNFGWLEDRFKFHKTKGKL